jgi:hypothetical protein
MRGFCLAPIGRPYIDGVCIGGHGAFADSRSRKNTSLISSITRHGSNATKVAKTISTTIGRLSVADNLEKGAKFKSETEDIFPGLHAALRTRPPASTARRTDLVLA